MGIKKLVLVVAFSVLLGFGLYPDEPISIDEFHRAVSNYLDHPQGKKNLSAWEEERLQRLIEQMGKSAVRDAVPDLIYLSDNASYDLSRLATQALSDIGDERAALILAHAESTDRLERIERPLSEVLSEILAHATSTNRLERIGRPLASVLSDDLLSPNDLVIRRTLSCLRDLKERHFIAEIPQGFEDKIIPLLRHPSLAVRYDALDTYLGLTNGYRYKPQQLLKDDTEPSIQERVNPGTLYGDTPYPTWLMIRAMGLQDHPLTRKYVMSTDWIAYQPDLQIRFSMTHREIDLRQPIYLLNEPVWVRVQLRNMGKSDYPKLNFRSTLNIEDAFGHVQSSQVKYDRDTYRGPLSVKTGQTLSIEAPLLAEFKFERNGEYYLSLSDVVTTPLHFSVRNAIEPLWPTYTSAFGFNPNKIYFPRGYPYSNDRTDDAPVLRKAPIVIDRDALAALRVFIEQKDREVLHRLTQKFSIEEISEILAHVPYSQWPLVSAEKSPLLDVRNRTGNEWLVDLDCAVDSNGDFHLAYAKRNNQAAGEVFVLDQKNGRWTEPSSVWKSAMRVERVRLLADRENRLFLFASVSNVTDNLSGYGARDLVCMMSDATGHWTTPQSCIPHEGDAFDGFDAGFDSQNVLHLAWAPWFGRASMQRVYQRTYQSGSWSAPQMLPGSARDLKYPCVSFENDESRIFASGQQEHGPLYGLYFLFPVADWPPQQFMNDVQIPVTCNHGGDLLVASQGLDQATRTVHLTLFTRGVSGLMREFDRVAVPEISSRDLAPVAVALDPQGRGYTLMNWRDNLILLRSQTGRAPEAIWFASARSSGDVLPVSMPPVLRIRNQTLSASWITEAEIGARLWFEETELPENGWENLLDLSFHLRPSTGLQPSDLAYLRKAISDEADAGFARRDERTAIERWLYLFANAHELDTDVPDPIVLYYLRGDPVVVSGVWKIVKEHPLSIKGSSFLPQLAGETKRQFKTLPLDLILQPRKLKHTTPGKTNEKSQTSVHQTGLS